MIFFPKTLFPAMLVTLFSYAAFSKLADIQLFREQLEKQPFSSGLADVLVYALPATELFVTLLLILVRTRTTGLLLSLCLLLLFTGYIVLGLSHFWPHVPCSCGGILTRMSWTQHLLFNSLFLIINTLAIAASRPSRPLPGSDLSTIRGKAENP